MKLTDKWLWNLIQDSAAGPFEDAAADVRNLWTRAADKMNRYLLEGQPTAGIYRCSRCGFEGHTWQGLLQVSSNAPICTECHQRLPQPAENPETGLITTPVKTFSQGDVAKDPDGFAKLFGISESDLVKMEREDARRQADGRDLVLSDMGGTVPGAVVLQPVTDQAEEWHESNAVPGTWWGRVHGIVIQEQDLENALLMARQGGLTISDIR